MAIRNIQSNVDTKIGFIKYNALKISGMICPFALTLLDGKIIMVSVSLAFTVVMNFVFLVKPIVKGKKFSKSSQEELESLNEALGERTNEEALTSATVSGNKEVLC